MSIDTCVSYTAHAVITTTLRPRRPARVPVRRRVVDAPRVARPRRARARRVGVRLAPSDRSTRHLPPETPAIPRELAGVAGQRERSAVPLAPRATPLTARRSSSGGRGARAWPETRSPVVHGRDHEGIIVGARESWGHRRGAARTHGGTAAARDDLAHPSLHPSLRGAPAARGASRRHSEPPPLLRRCRCRPRRGSARPLLHPATPPPAARHTRAAPPAQSGDNRAERATRVRPRRHSRRPTDRPITCPRRSRTARPRQLKCVPPPPKPRLSATMNDSSPAEVVGGLVGWWLDDAAHIKDGVSSPLRVTVISVVFADLTELASIDVRRELTLRARRVAVVPARQRPFVFRANAVVTTKPPPSRGRREDDASAARARPPTGLHRAGTSPTAFQPSVGLGAFRFVRLSQHPPSITHRTTNRSSNATIACANMSE